MSETLKLILQRMDFHTVGALANELEKLGSDAIAELRSLAEHKHRRALWEGKAYIRPEMAREMEATEAIAKGLRFGRGKH